MSKQRNLVSLLLAMIVPASLNAQQSGAMLHATGVVLLNGNSAPASSAIFSGDLIQTQAGAIAKIDFTGSTATMPEQSQIRLEDNEVFLEHGIVQLTTFQGMRVRVGCITIIPVKEEQTDYEVVDLDGHVTVYARENDVKIESRGASLRQGRKTGRNESTIVRETERKTRDEGCAAAARPTDRLAGKGAILNSPWTIGGGGAAIAILACLSLCHHDDPVSPNSP